MKKPRLFLAINLPSKLKSELLDYQDRYSQLPVGWIPKANLHITLVFLGETASGKIEKINEAAQSVQKDFSGFKCNLKKIVLAPPGSAARMFWVRVEQKTSLLKLQKELEESLVRISQTGYKQKSNRNYLPHITLGRINQDKWEQLEDRARVTKLLNLSFRADSFELMESKLKPSGAEYQLRNSFSLA